MASSGDTPVEDHLLAHPEARPVLDSLSTFIGESDRGAVLVAAAMVDDYLRKLFEGLTPSAMSEDFRKRLLDYPGPLSSFAAKADVALATRLIGRKLHRSIHTLRKIRNDVAHSGHVFRLADHLQRLRSMFTLGPGIPAYINESAARLLVGSLVDDLLESDADRPDEEKIFKNPRQVLEEISARPAVIETLQQKAYRAELGLAVTIICSLLVHQRDKALERVGDRGLIGSSKSGLGPINGI